MLINLTGYLGRNILSGSGDILFFIQNFKKLINTLPCICGNEQFQLIFIIKGNICTNIIR